MESEESLPIILVSATDVPTADKFITELIGEEEVAGAGAGQAGEGEAGAGEWRARVWQLHNKYYRARVALLAGGEGPGPPPAALRARVDAHLVLLAAHETESGAWVERRAAAGGAAGGAEGGGARVRLALAECAGERGAWAAAARARGYEPVPLRGAGAGAGGEEAEAGAGPRGLARAREALHAQTWRSLRLHGAGPPPPGSSSDSSEEGAEEEEEGAEEEEEWSEWQSAEMTRRRADQFAAALGTLAGAARGAGAGEGGREARLLAAEALLAALAGPEPPRPRPAPPAPPP